MKERLSMASTTRAFCMKKDFISTFLVLLYNKSKTDERKVSRKEVIEFMKENANGRSWNRNFIALELR